MAPWRLAHSLIQLRAQVDQAWPRRSRVSDGTIGDTAHQAGTSDHNPRVISGLGSVAVVTAVDLTHDPAHGADMYQLSERLRESRDPRIKYVIFDRRIFSAGTQPYWGWRPYSGSNPHDHHMHLSAVGDARADQTHDWSITTMFTPAQEALLVKAAELTVYNIHGWLGDLIKGEDQKNEAEIRRDATLLAAIQGLETALTDDQVVVLAGRIVEALGDVDQAGAVRAVLREELAKLTLSLNA